MENPDRFGRRKGILTVSQSCIDPEMPTEYRMEFMPNMLKLKVFSQDGSGRTALEGNVKTSCTIMPQKNTQYSKICRQRLIKSLVKDRYVKALEDLPKVKRTQSTLSIDKREREEDDGKRSQDFRPNDRIDKKVRLEKDELKNIVFHLFESREFWPLKEMNAHCRQPESYLKEVLKDICNYIRKGPNKSCYELKPQYKDTYKQS